MLLHFHVNTANKDQLTEKYINQKYLNFSQIFYFLTNSYFRIGSTQLNAFLEIKMVAGAFLSGLLILTMQRQIPGYE